MSSPSYYVDAATAPGYGTPTVTINAVTYVAENIQINRPSKDAKDYTALGIPQRNRRTVDWVTGTMTIQADSSTTKPQFGQTFTLTVDAAFGAELFVISEVPYEANNDAGTLRKINLSFERVVNGSVTTFA